MTRLFTSFCALVIATGAFAQAGYRPAPENLLSRSQFADCRFGIFLHWGLYAMLAQGEWAMTNHNLNYREYEKLAGGFYPSKFDADAWAEAFRQAGARYVCFTTRHHDGFSMFRTAQTPYNIVDATPFARDAVKELADACHRRGLRVHFYYSLIDWWREDAPRGRTGLGTGRPAEKEDADAYFDFMKAQLTELLTQYGNVGAIWFDGIWDQDENPGFDWRLGELYVKAGVALFGGCCGTTEEHIAALKAALKDAEYVRPAPECLDLLPAATEKEAFFLPADATHGAVLTADGDLEDKLSDAMDDEWPMVALKLVSWADVDALADYQYMIRKPLCLICDDAELLEAGLRAYQGRALYEGNLTEDALAPLVEKYGLLV